MELRLSGSEASMSRQTLARQDRVGARTPSDVERKYGIGQTFKATDERATAQAVEIRRMNAENQHNQGETDLKLNFINNKIEDINTNINALQLETVNINSSIVDIVRNCEDLTGRVTANEGSISSLTKSIKDLGVQLSSINIEIGTITARLEAVEEDIDKLKKG